MRYVLLALLTIGMMTYAVIDCVRTDDSRIRLGLPHWFWVVIILVLPFAGALTWLIASGVARRKLDAGPAGPARPKRPVAPDDDPDFLFHLERERRRRQKEREADEEQSRRPASPPAPDRHQDRSGQGASDAEADDEPLYVPDEFVTPDVVGSTDRSEPPAGTDEPDDEAGSGDQTDLDPPDEDSANSTHEEPSQRRGDSRDEEDGPAGTRRSSGRASPEDDEGLGPR